MFKQGNIVKSKKDFFKERFRTKEGLIDYLIGSFIWGFLIIEQTANLSAKLTSFYSFIPIAFIQSYLAKLTFATITSLIGLLITMTIIGVHNQIKKLTAK